MRFVSKVSIRVGALRRIKMIVRSNLILVVVVRFENAIFLQFLLNYCDKSAPLALLLSLCVIKVRYTSSAGKFEAGVNTKVVCVTIKDFHVP